VKGRGRDVVVLRLGRSSLSELNGENDVPHALVEPMKIYHLPNCSTCQKIIQQIPKADRFELQDIKSEPITPAQLDELKEMAGSYEALFSRNAMKYRSIGLNEMQLTEKDYRRYILEEYTFLKRPTIVMGDEIFIGNSKKVVEAAVSAARK
jgi:arsenate reductase (glutaredoxin)